MTWAASRSGAEPAPLRFHSGGADLDFDLLGFWKWSVSDLVSNATRGRLAEYIIATAIGAADGVRDEWAAYDLLDPRGISIEVKSAAYIQTWHQDRLSTISFNCAPSFACDPETNRQSDVKRRQATVTLDRRERSQHSITLSSLRALHGPPVEYAGTRGAIAAAADMHRQETS